MFASIKFFFNLSSGSQRKTNGNLLVIFLKFVKAPNIFHFVTHLKYPKTRTYLGWSRRGCSWQCCNGRSQLIPYCMSRSTPL